MFTLLSLTLLVSCQIDYDSSDDIDIVSRGETRTESFTSEGDGDASFQLEAIQVNEKLLNVIRFDDEKGTSYPEFYGGSYITDDGRLVVLVKGSLGEATVVDAFSDEERSVITFKQCSFSYQELTDVMDAINRKYQELPKHIQTCLKSWYIEDDNNRIVVLLNEMSDEIITKFKHIATDSPCVEFQLFLGTDIEKGSVGFFSSEVMPKNILSNSTTQIVLKPGSFIHIYPNDTIHYGSIGFRARYKNYQDVVGFVTADHVLRDYAYINTSTHSYNVGSCPIHYSYSDMDAVFVETKDSVGLTNTLEMNYSQGQSSIYKVQVLSTQTSLPGVGTVINKRGWRTGRTTGKVISTNATITDGNGNVFTNLTRTNVLANMGDSGGIFYTYISATNTRYTVGILKGGFVTNGIYSTYYSKADNVLNNMNLERY